MQTPIPTPQPIKEQTIAKPVDLGHDKLIEALFFFWDAFDRASMDFFLIRDTAHQAIENARLSGDKITIGIRRHEWQGGQQRVFRSYLEHENIRPKGSRDLLVFQYKDVPVYLYIYEDNPAIASVDKIFYAYDTFNIPNPIKEFEEKYDK